MALSSIKSSSQQSASDENDFFNKAKILVIDDDETICDILAQFLGQLGVDCDTTSDPHEAANWIRKQEYDTILSDIYMPEGIMGHDLLAISIEESPLTPFVLMTGRPTLDSAIDAIRLGAYDYLTKPFNLDYVQLTLTRALHYRRLAVQNRSYQQDLEKEVNERTRELQDFLLNSVQSLSNALEARDPYTQGHAAKVSEVVISLAREMSLDSTHDVVLRLSAQLHDIGKIGIPDSILLKPASLTTDEYDVMKSHAEIGYKILSPIPSLKEVSRYVYEHHERWDGKGYPQGLKEDEIHFISRLLMVAEVFDALATERVYKGAWTKEQLIDYYQENAGKAFDPDVSNALVRLIKQGKFDEAYNLVQK